MKFSSRRVEATAAAFWAKAGGRSAFGRPVDLQRAIALALPLAVCKLPALSAGKIAAVLARIRAVPWTYFQDRPLRGCLVADLGVGLVFIDATDPADEQLYSLAHELAHFLLHYLEPRLRALAALGHGIAEVLDRHRLPTTSERLSSAMVAVPLEPFRHAIERSSAGLPRHLRTEAMETEADALAFELLAPLAELRKRDHVAPSALAVEYGLPLWAAEVLATECNTPPTPRGVVHLFKK